MSKKHTYADREDGLAQCTVCGGGEGSLPIECPDARMTADENDAVYAGRLEYARCRWWAPRAEIAGYQRELAQARADIETVSRSRDAAIADRTAYADRYGAELRATVERLTRERDEAQASRRRFPIMGGPSIPWRVIAPHEAQARINHDQSLERLAQRGGLSPMEAHFVLADQRWRGVVTLDEAPWLAEMNAINAADDQQALEFASVYTNENIRSEIEKQLAKGEVFVRFATDVPGVVVPKDLKSEQYQNLKFSKKYRMSGGAGGCDLDVTDDRIVQTLSFEGEDFQCIVPFDAMCYIWVGPGNTLFRGEAKGSNATPQTRPMLKLVT